MAFDPADVTPIDGLEPLPTVRIAALLRAGREHIVTELTALGDDWARWRPAPGEWSANECLGHIVEADRRGFAGRIERILEVDGVAEAGWDQVGVAAARRDNERAVPAILAEFRAGRNAGITLVERLRVDQLDRSAVHDRVGRVTGPSVAGHGQRPAIQPPRALTPTARRRGPISRSGGRRPRRRADRPAWRTRG